MKHKQSSTWNVARKLKNVKDETQTLYDLDYGKKTEIRAKRETHTIRPGICRETVKNVNNVKCTLQDLDYHEKTDKREK